MKKRAWLVAMIIGGLTLFGSAAGEADVRADMNRIKQGCERLRTGRDGCSIMYGRYAEAEREFDAIWVLARRHRRALEFRLPNVRKGFGALLVGRDVKWIAGKCDELKEVCETGIELNPRLSSADVYELRLSAAIAPLKGSEAELVGKLSELEPAVAGELPSAERLDRLRKCASVACAACNDGLVRALSTYADRLCVRHSKKTYSVAWGGADKASSATLDRDYTGFKDVFQTDVSSGERNVAGGETRFRPTLKVFCDVWGLHFVLLDPDAEAEAIYNGFERGGTYELYLAPGPDAPYVMVSAANYGVSQPFAFNVAYAHAGYRPVDVNDGERFRRATRLLPEGLETRLSFAWDIWADHIPESGSRWDFEVVYWGRTGSAAWNGLRRIHGRSSWGMLSFDLSSSSHAQILRRQLARASQDYRRQDYVSGKDSIGTFDKWRDAEMGDPRFYEDELAPLKAELDVYLAQVTPGMDDSAVTSLSRTVLPRWRDLEYEVSARRAGYLRRKLMKEVK